MHGQVHHIERYVSNLTESKLFWHWLLVEQLGYTVFQEWEQGVSYKLERTYIVLVQTEPGYLEPAYHRKRSGLNHLAFHGRSRAFVDDLTEALKAKNIQILYADKHPYAGGENYYAVFFEDPDRMKLEVVAIE